MDIIVIGGTLVRNEERKKRAVRVPGNKAKSIERRRQPADHHQQSQDGVVVRLSCRNGRRNRDA